jgi:hypothetical protein
MRLIRWILCKMDIRHRPVEKWRPLDGSGLTEFSAGVWGCTVKDGQVNFCECRDCGTIIAPFEVLSRGWRLS